MWDWRGLAFRGSFMKKTSLFFVLRFRLTCYWVMSLASCRSWLYSISKLYSVDPRTGVAFTEMIFCSLKISLDSCTAVLNLTKFAPTTPMSVAVAAFLDRPVAKAYDPFLNLLPWAVFILSRFKSGIFVAWGLPIWSSSNSGVLVVPVAETVLVDVWLPWDTLCYLD